MKKLCTLLVIVTLLVLKSNGVTALHSPTVKQQLDLLNQYWIGSTVDEPVLESTIYLAGDVPLIQMHLTLVEKILRNKDMVSYTATQKQNRQKCLDILHEYMVQGVFPKNLYHAKRTPYFIDNFGTACAVGQLIISTGYKELAQKIMQENNYAYITELSVKYPEINEWANRFGFTLNELAWIQPCYCPGSAPGTSNVTCNGGFDGYFVPVVTGIPSPVVYNGWYVWSSGQWNMTWCGGCDLCAGDYKCTVIDALGDYHDYFYTVTEPPLIDGTITVTDDDGTCNGSAAAAVTGGTPGYTYLWMPGGYTANTVYNLCQGTYVLTITDNNGCPIDKLVTIGFTTGINTTSESAISLFPNPVTDRLTIASGNNEISEIIVSDLTSRKIIQQPFTGTVSLNTMQLAKGTYAYQVRNKNGVVKNGMLVKE